MADTTNQKALREFCNLSGCEVWKAIQKLEAPDATTPLVAEGTPKKPQVRTERTTLRIYCANRCMAYKLTKFFDGNNLKVVHKKGFEQYHG